MIARSNLKQFGLCHSEVAVSALFKDVAEPNYPFVHNGELYWIQGLAEQKGRNALHKIQQKRTVCLTREPFNIRTAVHVYGGCCHCLSGDEIIFNNYQDGCLYRQALTSNRFPEIIEASKGPEVVGYADLVCSPCGDWLIAVIETKVLGSQNKNGLIAIGLREINKQKTVILAQGADFYANPVISGKGENLAWIEWDHPNMPWDQARLMTADLSLNRSAQVAHNIQTVVDEEYCSPCQLGYLDNGKLLFVMDSTESEFWNFYSFWQSEIKQITHERVEFGEAHWVFGQSRWKSIDSQSILAIASDKDFDMLFEINVETGQINESQDKYPHISHLSKSEKSVLFVADQMDQYAKVMEMDVCSRQCVCVYENLPSVFKQLVSPELINFNTADNKQAYAYFYQPKKNIGREKNSNLPPLLIMIHGGPTAKCTASYAPLKQYFCDLGFAVLDINHRGSTGYGREYRQSLLGKWGVSDVEDIAFAIDHLTKNKLINADLVFIRGGSAGGYCVLRALTLYPEKFASGACYYGIGNLITLCEVTHKFEAKYTDQLVGEVFDPLKNYVDDFTDSLYITRSPIFNMDKLNCPLILFQGGKDEVVPPEISREVNKRLAKKSIKHAYYEYPDEGHGFRSGETKVHALKKEVDFFMEVIAEYYNLDS